MLGVWWVGGWVACGMVGGLWGDGVVGCVLLRLRQSLTVALFFLEIQNSQSGWYLSVPALRAAGLDPPRMRFYEALREGKAINSLARTSAFASSLIGDGVFRSGDCDATAARDCATLLKPTESYTALLVEQQIRGGGMNLTISHVGWSQMDLVAASTAPVLFYCE